MVKFDFSVTPKKSNRKSISHNKNTIILYKNVKGVVIMNIDSNFYVKYEDKQYVIKHTCYSCKDIEKVFRLGCDSPKKICNVRINAKKQELDNLYWVPFFAGSIVQGDIIFDGNMNITYFEIKKYDINEHNEESDIAFSFYKENYKEINNILNKKRIERK